MNLRWSKGQKYILKKKLYSNEHVDKVVFMVKSFITFYLIQFHKNISQRALFFCLFYLLNGVIFPRFCKQLQPNLNLGLLRKCCSLKRRVTRKTRQLVKKFSTRKISFQHVKFTFWNYKFLISTRKAAKQLINLFF